MDNGKAHYTTVAIVLHWLMGVLILAALAMGWYMVDLPEGSDERSFFFRHHKNVGLTVAWLYVIRLIWRFRHVPPPLPRSMRHWERRIANINHVLMYILMFLIPVTGYFTTSFTQWPTYYLGIPFNLEWWAWEDDHLNEFFATIHVTLAYTMLVLVVLHIAGAIKHTLVERDGVLQRMMPRKSND